MTNVVSMLSAARKLARPLTEGQQTMLKLEDFAWQCRKAKVPGAYDEYDYVLADWYSTMMTSGKTYHLSFLPRAVDLVQPIDLFMYTLESPDRQQRLQFCITGNTQADYEAAVAAAEPIKSRWDIITKVLAFATHHGLQIELETLLRNMVVNALSRVLDPVLDVEGRNLVTVHLSPTVQMHIGIRVL